jgi:hypothetical protein
LGGAFTFKKIANMNKEWKTVHSLFMLVIGLATQTQAQMPIDVPETNGVDSLRRGDVGLADP